MSRRIVVIGSGMAATRLVEELLARRVDGQITVLSGERHAPYNRILLSAVLEGTHRPEALTLRDAAWFAGHGVDLRLGARVLGIDRERRDVMLVDGTLIEYDDLVLATGAIPTLPPIRGLVRMDGTLHSAVHAFRTLDDCDGLLAALGGLGFEARSLGDLAPQPAAAALGDLAPRPVAALGDLAPRPVAALGDLAPQRSAALGDLAPQRSAALGDLAPQPSPPVEVRAQRASKPRPPRPPRRAVVVGGGLLGLQVARALGVRGLEVEIVEGTDHLLHDHVGGAAGRMLARSLTELGTEVYTGVRAVRLHDLSAGRLDTPARSSRATRRASSQDAAGRRASGVALQLDNGAVLDTDLVVLTAGGRPAATLAKNARLEVRRGIVVDDQLRSVSDDRIFAIGDCAQHHDRTHGFVSPAWEQAEVLAGVLAGESVKYDGSHVVARLRATDLEVAVLGDPEREVRAGGEVVEMSNPFRRSHRRLVVRDGRIVAGALVGDLDRVGLITQHYDRQTRLASGEPGDLLLAATTADPAAMRVPDDAVVCTCAGVTAGAVRGCSSVEEVRTATRATTGCGGCAPSIRQLLAERPAPAGRN